MSVIMCDGCGKFVDTDYEETYIIDGYEYCLGCMEVQEDENI